MTLVLTVHGRDTLWVVADRRLSYGGRRRDIDDAVKIMDLETIDGRGLLAYAGLGATAKGTQPSEWMSAVLRGHGGLRFEQALGLLSDAANRQFPRHLARMPGVQAHSIVIPAFIKGIGRRVYTIDNFLEPTTKKLWYRYTSHQRTAIPTAPSPQVVLAGSGGAYLDSKATEWSTTLRRIIKANDRKSVSNEFVADYLAGLNHEAYLGSPNQDVGPRCIVAWRHQAHEGRPQTGGGAHICYTGTQRDKSDTGFPAIANGMDVRAIADLFMQQMLQNIKEGGSIAAAMDTDHDKMNMLLGRLPSKPDERLR